MKHITIIALFLFISLGCDFDSQLVESEPAATPKPEAIELEQQMIEFAEAFGDNIGG